MTLLAAPVIQDTDRQTRHQTFRNVIMLNFVYMSPPLFFSPTHLPSSSLPPVLHTHTLPSAGLAVLHVATALPYALQAKGCTGKIHDLSIPDSCYSWFYLQVPVFCFFSLFLQFVSLVGLYPRRNFE